MMKSTDSICIRHYEFLSEPIRKSIQILGENCQKADGCFPSMDTETDETDRGFFVTAGPDSESTDKVIGFLSCTWLDVQKNLLPQEQSPDVFFTVCVAPEYRCQGIAGRLIHTMKKLCKTEFQDASIRFLASVHSTPLSDTAAEHFGMTLVTEDFVMKRSSDFSKIRSGFSLKLRDEFFLGEVSLSAHEDAVTDLYQSFFEEDEFLSELVIQLAAEEENTHTCLYLDTETLEEWGYLSLLLNQPTSPPNLNFFSDDELFEACYGMLMIDLFPDQEAAMFYNIGVDPDLRGQQIATRMLCNAAALLPDEIKTVAVQVNADNTAAMGLYRKLGFETAEDVKTWEMRLR